MRNILLSILIIAMVLNLNAQSIYDNNGISHKDFSILKSDSVQNSVLKIRLSGLNKPEVAEYLYGNNYSIFKYFEPLFEEHFTRMIYSDGLKLIFSDDYNHLFTFEITSDNYTMSLSNGQNIKVGMKGDELKAIFPKSYSKRTVITNINGMSGKTSFVVYFTVVKDNKILYIDEWIIFILSKEDGRLEKFFSYVPG